jgi:methylase of polypeptide subunit release factors
VFYTNELDGGGTSFGQDYISVIKNHYPNRKFPKIFEWCSGPGFIGFSLLSHEICDRVCFTDLYNPALEAIDATVQYKNNQCVQSISTYLMKDLSLLPNHEIFDMVVANPPHFNTSIFAEKNTNRLCIDAEWKAHKNFFKNIKSHLHKNSVVLLQENSEGSTVTDFSHMILEAGLEITDTFNSKIRPYYYIEIKPKNL